jgi:hypothetical protein
MTLEIDQSQFYSVRIANEKTLRSPPDPAREAALEAVRPRQNRQKYRQGMGRTIERIAAQRERIFEKLQIQSPDQLAETAVRLASRGERPDADC